MILDTTPENAAIVSNVGEIGEFRIRSSAKAFSILSSSLYANKIRAIIRELSCNAVDSHVAAGRADTPYDLHLPGQLEPWFSIRDYGVGLDHDQVTNIYTTYFESTKTHSNDFIGALGLGSKSPFAYTENFTVTAVKSGTKGIYTAFINDQGVPSIALMSQSKTDEPNGVEVKFSVAAEDFFKFHDEARQVFQFFQHRPVVSGALFEFLDPEFDAHTGEISPGVHAFSARGRPYGGYSVAIMGNIAYPIEVPNQEKNLGSLAFLLKCGLVIEFGIGELEFQPSREGLSYTEATVDRIRQRLVEINQSLIARLDQEATQKTNAWDLANFLMDRYHSHPIWRAPATDYVAARKDLLIKPDGYRGLSLGSYQIKSSDLAQKFNIEIKLSQRGSDREQFRRVSPGRDRRVTYGFNYVVQVGSNCYFVVSDKKHCPMTALTSHFLGAKGVPSHLVVYTLAPVDPKKEMDTAGFFATIGNPPESVILDAASIKRPESKTREVRTNSFYYLEAKSGYWGHRSDSYAWKSIEIDDVDDGIHYYLPLTGLKFESKYNFSGEPGGLVRLIRGSELPSLLRVERIYGVLKKDMGKVEGKSNWINLEDYIHNELGKLTPSQRASLALKSVDFFNTLVYNLAMIDQLPESSPYRVFMETYRGTDVSHNDKLQALVGYYRPGDRDLVDSQAVKKGVKDLMVRYPLIRYILGRADNTQVRDYICLVDAQLGTNS